MKKKSGRRFPLLAYKRAMDRLWHITLPFSLIMVGAILISGNLWPIIGYIPPIPSPYDGILMVGGVVTLAFTIFALLARNMAYAQARHDHFRLVTPFLSLKVSYRRVRSIRPTQFAMIFPPEELGRLQRKNYAHFYGMTALVIELTSYPTSPSTIRLMLGPGFLLPKSTGLVLLVPDWMALSMDIESSLGAWRSTSGAARRTPSTRTAAGRTAQKR